MFGTRTRIETGALGNSKMAYSKFQPSWFSLRKAKKCYIDKHVLITKLFVEQGSRFCHVALVFYLSSVTSVRFCCRSAILHLLLIYFIGFCASIKFCVARVLVKEEETIGL